ncbi:MAG: SDR family oxidoreductase [Candidatus Berkelbacteria bacterium]|nr:SDR family oxidoreductase [Candidatus Berkelbacteria bacterium]
MKQKVLILGANGMVGHKLFGELSKQADLDVWATFREQKTDQKIAKYFGPKLMQKVVNGIEANNFISIAHLLKKLKPTVLINCIGITKQLSKEEDPLEAVEINAALPHRLAKECRKTKTRMIQLATDCVFSGLKGNYSESDLSDATDLYGRTKFLGEVNYPHCLTIRTSFIGHELGTKHGLLEWFLSQKVQTKGFKKAIYSGMPTVLIAKVMSEHIFKNPKLSGLYQISTSPISKYDLLKLMASAYLKKIKIVPDSSVKIDRSLNSTCFRKATGYKPLSWPKMIEIMYDDYLECNYKKYNQ